MSAFTAGCAPSAARRRRGTCRSSTSSSLTQEMEQDQVDNRRALEDQARPAGGARPAAGKSGTSKGAGVEVRVNDFALKLANVNGTGSASANGLLMQAIFRMGIPVSGKNLFPSNIQGLPTWYEIRVNKA